MENDISSVICSMWPKQFHVWCPEMLQNSRSISTFPGKVPTPPSLGICVLRPGVWQVYASTPLFLARRAMLLGTLPSALGPMSCLPGTHWSNLGPHGGQSIGYLHRAAPARKDSGSNALTLFNMSGHNRRNTWWIQLLFRHLCPWCLKKKKPSWEF